MKKLLTIKKLVEYCEKNDIFVPKKFKREYLIAAITRYAKHNQIIKFTMSCFGWWGHDNDICIYCDYEKECFEVSIGMNRNDYDNEYRKLDNPKITLDK